MRIIVLVIFNMSFNFSFFDSIKKGLMIILIINLVKKIIKDIMNHNGYIMIILNQLRKQLKNRLEKYCRY